METVVLTIHLLLALALILVVLLQRSEGGGLGIGGGGGIMTSRGAATALSKVTWALGVGLRGHQPRADGDRRARERRRTR